jgi:hypothetical protein
MFWRKGNVQVVCGKYNVKLVETLEEAGRGGRRRGSQLNMGLKGRAESDFNNVIKDNYFPCKALAQHCCAYVYIF